MKDKYFVDTNIFVYSFDPREPAKCRKAQKIIEDALSSHKGIISYQVIQEFVNVAIRKFSKPLSTLDCKLYLDQVLFPLCEIYPSSELYKRALDVKEETGFSFYDSLIVSSAIEGGCGIIYSEDLQNNQSILGVTIRSPF